MMKAINGDQARALAALIAVMRTDSGGEPWQAAGILSALSAARHLGTAFELAHAAIYAASEPSNRTPAVIGMAGAHWARAKATSTTAGGDNMPGSVRCPKHDTERAHNCRSCLGEQKAGTGRAPDIPTQGMSPERITEIFAEQIPAHRYTAARTRGEAR